VLAAVGLVVLVLYVGSSGPVLAAMQRRWLPPTAGLLYAPLCLAEDVVPVKVVLFWYGEACGVDLDF